MGILEFFLNPRNTLLIASLIGIWTITLDWKSIYYFFDIIVIGGAFWFGLSLACINVYE